MTPIIGWYYPLPGGSWDLLRDSHKFVDNVAPVCLFSGIVFVVAGLWNLPPWLLVMAGAAMIAWVLVLSVWAVLKPGESCMRLIAAVDRASWPISWAAFQVAVVANYQTIVNTIDSVLVNNQEQARPWYLSHVPEAIVFLAILVTVFGLLATALRATDKDRPQAPDPDISQGAGTAHLALQRNFCPTSSSDFSHRAAALTGSTAQLRYPVSP